VTCRMGPGVGGGLQWSITIAGQTAFTATTAYHRPVIDAVGVEAAGGLVLSDSAAREALATEGGQYVVRLPPPPLASSTFVSVGC
jgi:hypothetical protein